MALYILENRSTEIEFVPPERPASATLSFLDQGGTELAAPTATLDAAVSTNIATVVSQSQFSTTGDALVPERHYWVNGDGGGVPTYSLVRVARVDPTYVWLEAPPAVTLANGDAFEPARFTATIPSSAVGDRALNYRCEWTVTGVDGVVRVYQQAVHVVRTLFRPAVLPDDVARYLSGAASSISVDRPFGYFAELARRASARVERKLLGGQRFQHLVGDYGAFVDAGIVALRLELALEGFVPPGFDPTNYVSRTDVELGQAIQEALAGTWYDENDDGAVNAETEVSGFYSARLVRR